ncbi:MAG: biopolymer transporter ExbD [Campylobacter sp.]|nr:biopolymer transporter ExbD [Campylobacter sp.]
MKFVKRDKKHRVEISMINLIDVIFMLLIFFMITTTFKSLSVYEVNLPKSSESFENLDEESINIIYFANENIEVKINNKNINFQNRAKLLNFISNLPKNISVALSADENIPYGKIVDLISTINKSGVSNLSLTIETIK